jgi:cephalosporin hydroxylase
MAGSFKQTLDKVLRHRRKLPALLAGRINAAVLAIRNTLGNSNFVVRLFRGRTVRSFNKLYYLLRKNTFDTTTFMGKHVLKFPTDLWSYQEIIFEKRPDVIVETGVFLGGSTFFYAKLQEMIGNGRVISIDITLDSVDPELFDIPNVTLLEGSTTDPQTLARVKALIKDNESVMVILDSDHTEQHVFDELRLFSTLVTDNQYLIVEDGLIETVYPLFNRAGPATATRRFLKQFGGFLVDHYRNRFLLSLSPASFLLKGTDASQLRFHAKEDALRPLRLWLPYTRFPNDLPWQRLVNQNKNRAK